MPYVAKIQKIGCGEGRQEGETALLRRLLARRLGCCRRGPYIGKRLVSLRELRALLDHAFPDFQVYSREANPQATSLPGRLFYGTRPWSERAFALVCDHHVAMATASSAGVQH